MKGYHNTFGIKLYFFCTKYLPRIPSLLSALYLHQTTSLPDLELAEPTLIVF